jgi:hypothetical protein
VELSESYIFTIKLYVVPALNPLYVYDFDESYGLDVVVLTSEPFLYHLKYLVLGNELSIPDTITLMDDVVVDVA